MVWADGICSAPNADGPMKEPGCAAHYSSLILEFYLLQDRFKSMSLGEKGNIPYIKHRSTATLKCEHNVCVSITEKSRCPHWHLDLGESLQWPLP